MYTKATQEAIRLQHVIYQQEENVTRSLLEVVRNYQRSKWILAPHQREFVWNEKKVKAWIREIKQNSRPEGCIVTYQIADGKESPIFINDGSQRIRATLRYLENSHDYGDPVDVAMDTLDAISVSVQHRHYKDHIVAVEKFQLLNMGTHLTALEFYAGILIYMPSYHDVWGPFLNRFNNKLNSVQAKVCRTTSENERGKHHKWRRDMYGLLIRLLGEVRSNTRIEVAESKIYGGQTEMQLRKILEGIPCSDLPQIEKRLNTFLDNEVSLIEKIWRADVGADISKPLNTTLFRWLLSLAAYRKNNQIPIHAWEEFLKLLFQFSNGTSDVISPERGPDGSILKTNVRLNDLNRLRKVQDVIGYDLVSQSPANTRKQRRIPMKNGYHASHIDPVSIAGDGPVLGEPGLSNLARGARPMTDEERNVLSSNGVGKTNLE